MVTKPISSNVVRVTVDRKTKPLNETGVVTVTVIFWFRLVRVRKKRKKNGGGAGTRTPDTGIMIPLLYQLSYTATGGFADG